MITFLMPIFFGFLLLGLPIFATLALSVFVVLFLFTDITLAIVPQRMFAGMNNFTLMAIPFFILAAELMRVGGLADRLIDLAKVLVGWIPGGLAATAVLSCVFFAAISGSSPATVAAIGKIMIPAMLAAGYSRMFSVGLITTAGTLGPIIPPSITLIVYGAVTGTSIGKLFAAGILPGILLATMLISYCYVSALRADFAGTPLPTLKEIMRAFGRASWGLGLPVMLLGGIYSGVFTPTESAAAACTYGFFVGIVIYRQIGLKEVVEILRSSGLMSGTLLLITAGASSFSWLLASSGIPGQLASQVLSLTDSPVILLLLFNAVLLVAGCFLDGASAVIVLSPLMEPIATQFGIDSVHFGIITLLNVSVGMVTPPVGLNLFVACAIAGMPIQKVFKATLPTLGILFVALFLITYIPWISTVVPDMMYAK
jgi:C4-dicarboxylate transporter, DctM subunit